MNLKNGECRGPLIDCTEEAALKYALLERFVRYAKIWTSSDPGRAETPTSAGQWELARLLQAEFAALGIDSELSGHCYLIARIPSNLPPGIPVPETTGFLAHLDTSGDVPGKDVKPVVVDNYDGRPIVLRDGVTIEPAADAVGKTIVHADGTTLLGADDKAGIAAIVSAAAFLVSRDDIKHGPLELIFTPDEETGRGLPEFPREKVKSTVCFTLDGGAGGELEIECFNAYGVDVTFTGSAIHPGAARGILVNAALMAAHFAVMLPRTESPEATDGRYGFYCLMDSSGSHESARQKIIVRDFLRSGIERRLAALESFARAVEAAFPGGRVVVDAKPSYYNMKEVIESRPEILTRIEEAAGAAGVDLRFKPVRGGTDGARLAEMGIPTPNIFTGGRNFHSRSEWLLLEDLLAACRLTIQLAASHRQALKKDAS
ncbi:MAG: peptidase T [Spirochaetaceae bacterium]|jgi:tripeptide aminopeptidase|nr:peptidase T [Spirochaetaceae bacterium]